MSDKPRKVWQIHLSTLIVTVLASGGFLSLNAIPTTVFPDKSDVPILTYGWPLTFTTNMVELTDEDIQRISANWGQRYEKVPAAPFFRRRWVALTLDIITLVLGSAAVAILWETFIRRDRVPCDAL